MLRTQNKGEWAEIYCIVKILSEWQLNLCDSYLDDTGEFIKILGGYIGSKRNHPKFSFNSDSVVLHINTEKSYRSKLFFLELQQDILLDIQQDQKNTFSITKLSNFLDSLQVQKIKSSSFTKADVLLLIDDKSVIDNDYSGFSIKSFLASNPTLVNASKATNFIFSISNIIDINDYTDLKSKTLVKKLIENNATLSFFGLDSDIFQTNLMLVDTNMPLILSEALKIYYSSKKKFLREIVEDLMLSDPLKLPNTSLYINKIKDYLFYSNVGIFPDKLWDGLSSVDGGAIIISKKGCLKTFYTVRKSYLEHYREFLFNSSYFDTASNSRHNFGSVYQESSKFYLKLNLQIRLDLKGSRCYS